MKKLLYFFGLSALVMCGVNHANAQGVEQGNIIIDPYYGYPNFGKNFFDAVETANPGGFNFDARGIGPAGIRLEYMVTDRIGVGGDFIYSTNGYTFQSRDSIYNGTTGQYDVTTNNLEYKMSRIRIQLRMNYHFEISNPNFDSYVGFGAGTNNRKRVSLENGQDISGELGDFTLLPFSLRVCLGMRYFFTDNIGINTEIGIGGPVISGGLSFKF